MLPRVCLQGWEGNERGNNGGHIFEAMLFDLIIK
jgi:hypothetical protein